MPRPRSTGNNCRHASEFRGVIKESAGFHALVAAAHSAAKGAQHPLIMTMTGLWVRALSRCHPTPALDRIANRLRYTQFIPQHFARRRGRR